jgi:hypothetical protein
MRCATSAGVSMGRWPRRNLASSFRRVGRAAGLWLVRLASQVCVRCPAVPGRIGTRIGTRLTASVATAGDRQREAGLLRTPRRARRGPPHCPCCTIDSRSRRTVMTTGLRHRSAVLPLVVEHPADVPTWIRPYWSCR